MKNTEETSQADRSALNWVAPQNILAMTVTEEVSQADRGRR